MNTCSDVVSENSNSLDVLTCVNNHQVHAKFMVLGFWLVVFEPQKIQVYGTLTATGTALWSPISVRGSHSICATAVGHEKHLGGVEND